MTEPGQEAASLQRLLAALTAARDGDVSVRLPESSDPLMNEISTAFNSLADRIGKRAAARERFLPTLSHELRTPLNSMLVLARLLAENAHGNLNAEQVEYARVIHSAGTDLLSVISGMLDVEGHANKPDEGTPAPEPGKRLLVVEGTRGGLLTLLARGAVSDLHVSGRPTDLPASPARPPGRRAVEVVSTATVDQVASALESGTPHCVLLDLGAGGELVSAALKLLRTRPGSRWVPVLAHARDDVAAARFAGLRVQSAELVRSPGQLRARLTWHLSAARTSQSSGTVAASTRDAALRGKKILVVDDDPRNVFAIKSTLELYGMTVLRSADGRAGIDQLRGAPDTDLVLMDLMMPNMDGYAAISAIREMPEFSALPIIAVTAHTMTGELAGGVPGADDCLAKPLDTDELLVRMARCLVP